MKAEETLCPVLPSRFAEPSVGQAVPKREGLNLQIRNRGNETRPIVPCDKAICPTHEGSFPYGKLHHKLKTTLRSRSAVAACCTVQHLFIGSCLKCALTLQSYNLFKFISVLNSLPFTPLYDTWVAPALVVLRHKPSAKCPAQGQWPSALNFRQMFALRRSLNHNIRLWNISSSVGSPSLSSVCHHKQIVPVAARSKPCIPSPSSWTS